MMNTGIRWYTVSGKLKKAIHSFVLSKLNYSCIIQVLKKIFVKYLQILENVLCIKNKCITNHIFYKLIYQVIKQGDDDESLVAVECSGLIM